MKLQINPVQKGDIDTVFAIQQAAYKPLFEKYRDAATNPYMESRETVLRKYTRAGTIGYLFVQNGYAVGAVRLSIDHERHWGRVSALCVLPQYQGQGIAQCALREIERRHTDIERWYLDTILEEAGNCHLYEKLGYCRTGTPQPINAYMTLVNYEKNKQS